MWTEITIGITGIAAWMLVAYGVCHIAARVIMVF